MNYIETETDHGLNIQLRDDLIAGTADELSNIVEKIFRDNLYGKSVLLDFACVGYMDSAGISALLRLNKTAKSLGGTLKLYSLPDNIQRILGVTRVEKLFNIYKDFKEACSLSAQDKGLGVYPLEYRLTIPSEYFYSKMAVEFIMNALRSFYEVSDIDEMNLRISLEEALTNAIEHGYKDFDKYGQVIVGCLIMGDFFIIAVDDKGQGFDREKVLERIKQVPLNPYSDRGRGIFLISELMDELSVESSGKGSVFFMVKSLPGKVEAS